MPKKKKITLIISILAFTVLIIIISLIALYFSTDMFKSNQTLFLKYLGKNTENLETVRKIFEKTEYEKLLENNKYSEDLEIKFNYTEDYGTTSENTSNSINKLKLTINGQADKENQYDYKDFVLWNDDKQILNMEYARNNNIYGIKFSDLFKQYVLVENNNLKELFEKLEYSGQDIEKLPDSIQINQEDLFNSIKFNDEEIEELKEKYLNIINQNLSKENFEKKSNQTIYINEKEAVVDAYILKLTNEQLNNIYIKILENLKNEDIVLAKLDNIQNLVNKISSSSSDTTNLKEDFIQEVEYIIEEINKNNIGAEETRIIVYENQGKTLRTEIQGLDYEIVFDCFEVQQEQFWEFAIKENETETQKLTIKKDNAKLSFCVENKKGDTPIVITYEEEEKVEDKKCTKNINIKHENGTNRLEVDVINDTNIIESFENQIIFDDQNAIKLNDLEQKQLETILNRVNEGIQQKWDEISQEMRIEDIQSMLQDVGIIQDTKKMEGEGVSETEKNRFNSKFEILQGEKMDSEKMLEILEIIKDNLVNFKAVSNEQLKIEIDKNNKNEELSNTLEEFVKKDKNRKYNVSIEYDDTTGLVKYMVLTIVKEQ